MSLSKVTDLGLHCLPMTHKKRRLALYGLRKDFTICDKYHMCDEEQHHWWTDTQTHTDNGK